MHAIEMRIGATYQPRAECDDCDHEWQASGTTRDRAKDHARLKGHNVRIIVEKVSVWGPKL